MNIIAQDPPTFPCNIMAVCVSRGGGMYWASMRVKRRADIDRNGCICTLNLSSGARLILISKFSICLNFFCNFLTSPIWTPCFFFLFFLLQPSHSNEYFCRTVFEYEMNRTTESTKTLYVNKGVSEWYVNKNQAPVRRRATCRRLWPDVEGGPQLPYSDTPRVDQEKHPYSTCVYLILCCICNISPVLIINWPKYMI